MTKLSTLHKRLAKLRRRRRRLRWETAYSAVALAVLWVLAAVFLVDWLFEMNRLQRAIVLVVCAAVTVWAFRRYALPWLGQRETELDMALLVEREEHIDTDLIAAVQFEQPDAPEWGSVQLEQAVIDRVAARQMKIDVMRGLSRKELSRRAVLLAITLLAWTAVAVFFHQHVLVFLNRLALGVMHYPTRTVIESIAISGHRVDPVHSGRTPIVLQYGDPVRFEVRCSGEIPEEGTAELTATGSGLHTRLTIKPTEEGGATFAAELPRLVDSVRYQLFFGDAWTDPGRLKVGRLPAVEIELEVEPPPYARTQGGTGPIAMPRGLRQVSVIEGSRVVVKLYSDKPLTEATLAVDEEPFGMHRTGERHWTSEADDSPLAAVVEPVRYAIQVTDEDGLQLERPIEGVIRIRADSAPRIGAAAVTLYVLPTGRPTIDFQAIDDYGLARLVLQRKIIRADGAEQPGESEIYRLPEGQKPQKDLKGRYPFELAPLELHKGDRVEATLWAVDYRGPREGKSDTADTLVFHVTDEQGILEHVGEEDRLSARQLKTMIQRQLGIGDSP